MWSSWALLLLLGCTASSTDSPSPAPALTAGTQAALVVRLVDGDTLILRGVGTGPLPGADTRVRVIGLDTPELGERPECFGPQAAKRAGELVPAGSEVRVGGDREPMDRYGRSLLHVWTADGQLMAEALVRDGYGRALPVRPNDRYADVIAAAERDARRTGRGLWSACR